MKITLTHTTNLILFTALTAGCATQNVEQTSSMDPMKEQPVTVAKVTEEPTAFKVEAKSADVVEQSASATRHSTVYFDYDSSDINEDAKNIIATHIHYLKDHPNLSLTVGGYADDRGSNEYNLKLGKMRAQAIKEILIAENISEEKIHLISYGENKPAVNSHSDIARSFNRRATFVYHDNKNQLASN